MREYFGFSEALRLLKRGNNLRRKAWHHSLNYIYFVGTGFVLRSKASYPELTDFELQKEDILAEDWYLYNVSMRNHSISKDISEEE